MIRFLIRLLTKPLHMLLLQKLPTMKKLLYLTATLISLFTFQTTYAQKEYNPYEDCKFYHFLYGNDIETTHYSDRGEQYEYVIIKMCDDYFEIRFGCSDGSTYSGRLMYYKNNEDVLLPEYIAAPIEEKLILYFRTGAVGTSLDTKGNILYIIECS